MKHKTFQPTGEIVSALHQIYPMYGIANTKLTNKGGDEEGKHDHAFAEEEEGDP